MLRLQAFFILVTFFTCFNFFDFYLNVFTSMVYETVCLSVCLSYHSGLLLIAVQIGDTDRQQRPPSVHTSCATALGHSTALSCKCEQCHVDS